MVTLPSSPFACIRTKKISKGLQKRIDDMEKAMRLAHPTEGDTEIASRVAEGLKLFVEDSQRAVLIQIEKQRAIDNHIFSSKLGSLTPKERAKRQFRRIVGTIEGDMRRRDVDYPWVYGQWNGSLAILHRIMQKPLQNFTRRVWTLGQSRNKALQRQMVQAVFGLGSNPTAKQFAAAWREIDELYILQMNKNGAILTFDPDRQFITEHKVAKLNSVTDVEWMNDILTNVDLARMINPDTGIAFTAAELTAMLPEIRKSILSGGLSNRTLGAMHSLPLWKRLDETHFFVWKDFDAWERYNTKYGFDDLFTAMVRNMDMKARFMGIVDVLGPDPEAMAKYLEDLALLVSRDAGEDGTVRGDAVREAFDIVIGKQGMAANTLLAEAGSSLRQLQHSAILGQLGPLSFLTDNINSTHARMLAGLNAKMTIPQFFGKAFPLMFRGPKSNAAAIAIEMGGSLQSIRHSILGSMRGVGEMNAWKTAHFLSDTNFRMFGQTVITDALQAAYISEFNHGLLRELGKTFDNFGSPRFARTLEHYGFSEADWLRISDEARPYIKNGRFSLPDMAREHYDDAVRLMAMLEHEKSTQAVISGQPETRRRFTGGTKPGSVGGETFRSMTDLMQFPVTFMFSKIAGTWLTDYLAKPTRLVFLGGLLTAMTLAGGMVTQMRQTSAGREWYDWDDPKFLLQALAMGGGLGVVGDLLFRENYGASDSLIYNFFGPTFSTLSTLASLGANSFQTLFSDEPYNIGRDFVRLLRGVTPFATGWPVKVVIDRLFFDTIQRWIDPNAQELFRSRIRAPMQDHGQGYWWAPGQTSPSF